MLSEASLEDALHDRCILTVPQRMMLLTHSAILQSLKQVIRKRTANAIAYHAEAEGDEAEGDETEKRSSSAVSASSNMLLGPADML